MKRTLKLILAFIALIYVAPKAMAQGFIEPKEHTREYHPSEGFTNVTLFELTVYGNEDNSTLLQQTMVQLDPSIFTDKVSNVRVSIYYEKMDTSDFYDQDVIFDKSGTVYLFTNFVLVKQKFVQKLIITGDINTNSLYHGDKLNIKVSLGMGIDGGSIEYYHPETQSLIYRGGKPSYIKEINSQPVNIYPNPFVNEINIDLQKEENILITNLVGETVYTGLSGKIETPMFPSGVYFIHTIYGIRKVFKH